MRRDCSRLQAPEAALTRTLRSSSLELKKTRDFVINYIYCSAGYIGQFTIVISRRTCHQNSLNGNTFVSFILNFPLLAERRGSDRCERVLGGATT